MSELLRSIIAAKAKDDVEKFVRLVREAFTAAANVDRIEVLMIFAIETLAADERKKREDVIL